MLRLGRGEGEGVGDMSADYLRRSQRGLDRGFVVRSLLVIAVAVLARLFFVIYSAFWAGDSDGYERIALNLLAGHGFAMDPASPTVFRPPAYPFFIALVYAVAGPYPGLVLLTQAFVGGLAIWCVYLLGRRLLSDNVALAGALLAGAYPHLAWYSATILSETLSVFLLAVALLGASYLPRDRVDLKVAAMVGAAFALSALATPRLAVLPLGVGVVLLLQRVPFLRVMGTLSAMFAGYATVLAPWVIRNLLAFGVAVPLVIGMQGLVYWLPAYRVPLYDYRFQVWAQEEPLMAKWLELYTGPGIAREREQLQERIELEGELLADAGRKIAADPPGYLRHQLGVLPALWVQPAAYAGHFRAPLAAQNDRIDAMVAQGNWLSVAARLASIAVFTFGLFGGVAVGLWALRHRLREVALLLIPAVHVVIFHSFAYIEHRFSIAAHPFLWLIAAAGWAWAFDRVRRARGRLR